MLLALALLAGCGPAARVAAVRDDTAEAKAWVAANAALQSDIGSPIAVELGPRKGAASCGGDGTISTCSYELVAKGPRGKRDVRVHSTGPKPGEMAIDRATVSSDAGTLDLLTGERTPKSPTMSREEMLRALDREIAEQAGIKTK